ncbi:MAG: hypothetical protein AAGC97_09030 [Planctomycetota bacterium]
MLSNSIVKWLTRTITVACVTAVPSHAAGDQANQVELVLEQPEPRRVSGCGPRRIVLDPDAGTRFQSSRCDGSALPSRH